MNSTDNKIKIKFILFFVISAIAVFIDRYTKILAVANLKGRPSYVLIKGVFEFLYSENRGAAFSILQGKQWFFYIVTLLVLLVIYYIVYKLPFEKKYMPLFYILCFIFAGALGNIIDSVFYGVIFDHSVNNVATFMSDEPYGTLFHGRVVDMLYFPIIDTYLPDWVPFYGGKRFTFFDPIFNVADTAISVAVGLLLIFNKQAFKK